MKQYDIVVLSSPGPMEVVRGTAPEIVTVLRHLWNKRHQTEHLANPYVTCNLYLDDRSYMKDITIAVMQDTGKVPAWTLGQLLPERFLKFMTETGRITFSGEEIVALGCLKRSPEEESAYRSKLITTFIALKGDDAPMPDKTWL